MTVTITQPITARIEVKKIRFEKDGFYIFVGHLLSCNEPIPIDIDEKKCIVRGKIPLLSVGDELEVEGQWERKIGYDKCLSISKQRKVFPSTAKGITSFLKKNVKGLGKKKAEAIVQAFGIGALDVLKDPNRIVDIGAVEGIGAKLAMDIQEEVARHFGFEEVLLFLSAHQVHYQTIVRAYERYQGRTIQQLKTNPYELIESCRATFEEVDRIAKTFDLPSTSIERILWAMIHVLQEDVDVNGNLYMNKQTLIQQVPSFLAEKGAYETKVSDYLPAILQQAYILGIQNKKLVAEKDNEEQDIIFLVLNYAMEKQIANHVSRLLKETPTISTEEEINQAIATYEASKNMNMDEKQKQAVHCALTNGVSILTGGPGTGKTQTITAIIHCLETLLPKATISLCAPTGKASKRMTDLTGKNAMTIHRLLGIGVANQGQEVEEIDCDLLIIDEASMVDIYIAYRLLKTVSSSTRVLFVGDYHQLPSVGAGLILRDFILSRCLPMVELTTIFRQAQESSIVMNAHAVLHKARRSDNLLRFNNEKKDCFFIEEQNTEHVQQLLIRSVERFLSPTYGYELNDIQLLTCMIGGSCGVSQLNKKMQVTFNPPTKEKAEWVLEDQSIFREGDKVIHTKNNKKLKVFNGETGIIHSISYDDKGDPFIEVQYDERMVGYRPTEFEELDLAYCLSIHKSQGSEFPVVIVPIDDSQRSMLSQNMIYTAWTRSKERLVNVGSTSLLYEAIQKETAITRTSLLVRRLQEKNEQIS